ELLSSYQILNQQLWKDYEENKRTREEVLNTRFGLFFEQLGKKVDSVAVEKEYRQYLNQGSQRLGNSLAIVSDLAKKADLYVVTNGVAKTQYQRLEAAKLLPYFKEIFVSETIGYQKPRIEFFQHVFHKIAPVDLEKTVIIGDSLSSDIQGGKNAGIDTIWLNANQQKANIQPTHTIQTLDEIYQIL
ncbi:YjjG family noncanonical pyrimidine nucleotidase, partial [Enterococcus cecorum]